ncbi:TetR/AcrR family transcriptional regulator [Paractinoplanes lichenicola]|uniref:TetR/AcrR family transcriptional regulator n=1 Tax=Paractinoplanes lichenicola TaxID=2802976 RepID=A0ABS1VIJ8_9ACTN|nr:TetR/AcrR family transcriptional regulator [Actinoplanes lichenicola]MBL7253557.1 TetR/AcrR family transcriptional regulator [Actinoplanes lichenicola]
MSPTDTSAGPTRNTERTRLAIFAATARAVVRHGAGVSIGKIAEEAKVSKGGLLHHFPSREALFEAVATDLIERFRQDVYARVDLAENHPGKLLRGYVRAMCADLDPDSAGNTAWEALIIFRSSPGVAELIHADAERWDVELTADGLDPDRVALVQLAADGLSALVLQSAELAQRHLVRMRPLLLELTENNTRPS